VISDSVSAIKSIFDSNIEIFFSSKNFSTSLKSSIDVTILIYQSSAIKSSASVSKTNSSISSEVCFVVSIKITPFL
jgi:hypothetical protein